MTRKEWEQSRKKGIGASDAAAILGLSPYKSNVQLWEEKTGRQEPEDISNKPYVEYGTKAEQHIRALFALDHPEYEVSYNDFDVVTNPEYPFIFATLDGRLKKNGEPGVLEIKTFEVRRSSDWQLWDKRVPQNYYIQVLHQLLATGWHYAVLTTKLRYTDKNGDICSLIKAPYHFDRDNLTADLDYLLAKEIEFWHCVTNDIRPALILPEI